MAVLARHIFELMEEMAPAFLAEPWDNVGLQVGHRNWPVERIWIALDATHEVVSAAAAKEIDLLITHHPLIFQPLKALDVETCEGSIIDCALTNKIAIFSAHTNLDSAMGGVNDVLVQRLGLTDAQVLKSSVCDSRCKLVVFVPKGYEEKILQALFESGAGITEKYSHVSFRTEGTGTFKPGDAAKPFDGRIGETSHSAEYRIEVLVNRGDVASVVKALRRSHPYEEMAYDIYETVSERPGLGLGRTGNLEKALTLEALVERLKNELGLHTVKVAGDTGHKIERVAVCGGSGRGLLNEFLASDAQVFVSGDFGYHDGRKAEAFGRVLIDVGHFASEHLVVKSLASMLTESLSKKGYTVEVDVYGDEKDCFYLV